MDRSRDREDGYPRPCPVCRVAMVGQDADDGADDLEIFACLNCGTVVVVKTPGTDDAMG